MLPRCSTPCLPLGAAREVGTPPHSARAAIVAPQSASVRFTAVSVGRHHTCGLTPAGSAYCWGDNSRGQLGDETTTARSSPVLVVGRVSFAAVSAGGVALDVEPDFRHPLARPLAPLEIGRAHV